MNSIGDFCIYLYEKKWIKSEKKTSQITAFKLYKIRLDQSECHILGSYFCEKEKVQSFGMF